METETQGKPLLAYRTCQLSLLVSHQKWWGPRLLPSAVLSESAETLPIALKPHGSNLILAVKAGPAWVRETFHFPATPLQKVWILRPVEPVATDTKDGLAGRSAWLMNITL